MFELAKKSCLAFKYIKKSFSMLLHIKHRYEIADIYLVDMDMLVKDILVLTCHLVDVVFNQLDVPNVTCQG